MVIENDLFDIAKRVREIDPAYFIVHNGANGKFELHSKKTSPTYVLSFPDAELDARAVTHTLRTRFERHEKLLKEIDENNLKLERDALKDAKNAVAEALEGGMQKC